VISLVLLILLIVFAEGRWIPFGLPLFDIAAFVLLVIAAVGAFQLRTAERAGKAMPEIAKTFAMETTQSTKAIWKIPLRNITLGLLCIILIVSLVLLLRGQKKDIVRGHNKDGELFWGKMSDEQKQRIGSLTYEVCAVAFKEEGVSFPTREYNMARIFPSSIMDISNKNGREYPCIWFVWAWNPSSDEKERIAKNIKYWFDVLGMIDVNKNQKTGSISYVSDYDLKWNDSKDFNDKMELLLAVTVKKIRKEKWSLAFGVNKVGFPHEELLKAAKSENAMDTDYFRLGMSYLVNRPNSPTDLVEAYYWFDKAANASNRDYYIETRDNIGKLLTDADIAKYLSFVQDRDDMKARPSSSITLDANRYRNVALGKSVTTSSNPIIGNPQMITDGNKKSNFDSYIELGPFKEYITIDLDKEYEIHAIRTWHYYERPQVYRDVVIQIANKPNFTDAVVVFNNDSDNTIGFGNGKDQVYKETNEGKAVYVEKVRGRYVRLYSNGNTENDLNRYIEVEVLASTE
jgi:hypothetical protein